MTIWKFHCDSKTLEECLRRRLVGAKPEVDNLGINRGDTVLLHQLDDGTLYGPFIAESSGLNTIEPDAWREQTGDWSNQVQISFREDDLYRIDVEDLDAFPRITEGDVFYDLTSTDAERLVEQLRIRGTPIALATDGAVTELDESAFNPSRLAEGRNIWQITPGINAELWSTWREHSIASLGCDLYGSATGGSREDRLDEIAEYDESRQDTVEYQAYLFQEGVDTDDVVVVRDVRDGEVVVYGLGRVVDAYRPEFPTKVTAEHEADVHQITVSWIEFGDDGIVVDLPPEEKATFEFARFEEENFESIVEELVVKRAVDKKTLVRKFGVSLSDDEEQPRVGIPKRPEEVHLDGLWFPDEERLLNRILAALQNGKHLILTGPPGTGKTKLAEAIAATCTQSTHKTVTATADWSTFETIGGYRPGKSGDLEFTPGVFLECFDGGESSNPGQWLVVDEINRCDIDKAFGALFTALTGETVTLPFETDGSRIVVDGEVDSEGRESSLSRYVIPESWRIIATMNTYDRMSLNELSYAFTRRFGFVTVPAPDPSNINIGLIQQYVDRWDSVEDVGQYSRAVANLWEVVNASKSRKIGPALVRDLVQFVDATEGDFTGAVTMYVLPQFDGLPTPQKVAIVENLLDLEEPTLREDEVREFAREYFELTSEDYERFGV